MSNDTGEGPVTHRLDTSDTEERGYRPVARRPRVESDPPPPPPGGGGNRPANGTRPSGEDSGRSD